MEKAVKFCRRLFETILHWNSAGVEPLRAPLETSSVLAGYTISEKERADLA
jgi:hypothetical protein